MTPRAAFLATVSLVAVTACAPIPETEYAEVCDDTAEPDCAPGREVIISD